MIIKIGKCVNTHGLKGEVRILTKNEYKKQIFTPGFRLLFSENYNEEVINTYRHHKDFEMVTLKGINDINDVLKYKGQNVYINSDDLVLDNNQFIKDEVIGYNVLYNQNLIGQIKEIMYNNGNDLFVINGEKEILIPINEHFISKVNKVDKIIELINIEGLI